VSKKKNNTKHLKQRAAERLGISLNRSIIQGLIQLIASGHSLAARKQTNTRTYHLLEVNGITAWFLYDRNHKNFITVIPAEVEER
jgi:hypothetical protein